MEHLRHPSPRPTITVDPAGFGLEFGLPAPLGRQRIVSAVPLEPGPALIAPPTVVRDPSAAYLADKDGALIGTEALWVSRMAFALPTEDTRRIGP